MKTNPALDALPGQSHRGIVRVDLHQADGTLVGTLPVVGGAVFGSARFGERWAASIDLAGDEWAPQATTDPLSGFAGHYVAVHAGGEVSTVDQTVEVCRLLINGTRTVRAANEWRITMDCIDLLGYVAQGAPAGYQPLLDETCQAMIRRIVEANWPPQWVAEPTFVDTTTPVVVPVGAYWEEADPGTVIYDLASIANISMYADWDGRIVLRDPLPDTPTAVVRSFAADTDLVRYEKQWGRDNFANTVRIAFNPVGANSRATFRATWSYAQQSGAPAQGQIKGVSSGGGTATIRVHRRDQAGYRRGPGLERAAQGDLIRLLDDNDGELVGEIQSATDDTDYYTFVVYVIAGDLNLTQGAGLEFQAYITQSDPVVGTATLTTGPLAVGTVGKVLYEETHEGGVSQAVANARAQSLLRVMSRGYAGHIITTQPDPRLEPHDDIAVDFGDGTTLTSRITELELPLTIGEPMTIAVRPFTTQ